MTVALTIRVDNTPEATRLVLTGEIDLGTTGALREALGASLREHRPAVLIVDLSGVSFLDSTGIAALIRGRHLAAAYHADYQVVGADGAARWTLEVAGVLDYLAGEVPLRQTRDDLRDRRVIPS